MSRHPTESRDRRYLLRIWATISTPLLLGFIAILVRSGGPSLAVSAIAGLVVVLGIEALTRGRFQSYVIRVLVGVVLVIGGWLLVLAFAASWRALIVGILLTAAGAFLVANLRELRRN